MRSARRFLLASAVSVALTAASPGLIAGAQAALDGSVYAVVTTAYDGSGGNANTSFIRFFNGGSNATTFSVTIIGSQSAKTYGKAFAVQIPPRASPQYSLGALLSLAGSAAGAGAANGDTSFALFIKDSDQAAGYQHVTFNGNTLLFENATVCNNGLLPAALSGVNVLTNVHTSRLGGYPSVVNFYNYSSSPVVETVTVADAGVLNADGATLTATAGSIIGSTTIQIPANTVVTKNFTDFETALHWTPSTTQLHANIIASNASGPPNVILSQSIHNNTLVGDINMTTACSVNKATSSGGTGSGSSQQAQTFIPNGPAGTTYPLSAGQTFSAFNVTNGAAVAAGTALPEGTLVANATGSITTTAGGFTFTLPDGKVANFDLSAGSQNVDGTNDFTSTTTDGSRKVEIKLQNGKAVLSYSTFGTWNEGDSSEIPSSVGTLATGVATAAAQMPTTGRVTYSGDIAGFGFNTSAFGEIKSGTVSLTVDFAAKTITGSAANIVTKGVDDSSAAGSMNGLTLTGTVSGTGFTITASAAAANGASVDISGASGTFTGSFFGTNAAELAAASAMTGGGSTIVLAFGAHQ